MKKNSKLKPYRRGTNRSHGLSTIRSLYSVAAQTGLWLAETTSGSDQSELRSFLNELGEGGSEGEAGEERRCVTSPKLFVEAFV